MQELSEANAIFDRVFALDLSASRERFVAAKGFWWRLGHNVDRVEQEYRRFLFIATMNLNHALLPCSDDLHDFWKAHLDDPKQYAIDCETITSVEARSSGRSVQNVITMWMSDELANAVLERKKKIDKQAKRRAASSDPGFAIFFSSPGASCAGSCGCGSHGGHGCGGHGCGGHGCGGGH